MKCVSLLVLPFAIVTNAGRSHAFAFQFASPQPKAITFPIIRNDLTHLRTNNNNPKFGDIIICSSFQKQQQLSLTAAAAVASLPDDDERNNLMETRRQQIVAQYSASSMVSLLSAMTLFVGYGGFKPFALYAASGPFMTFMIAYILRGAAKKDRLSSDTNKRLNQAQFHYGFLGLVTLLLASPPTRALWVFGIITNYLTMNSSVKGWYYGVHGIIKAEEEEKNVIREWFQMKIDIFFRLFSPITNIHVAGYFCSTIFVGALTVYKVYDLGKSLFSGDARFLMAAKLIRLAKLQSLFLIMFVLKDAANRDRLEGTTFIQLNFVSSLVFGTMAAYFSQVVVPTQTFITTMAGIIAFFTAWNGVVSVMKKRTKETTQQV